MTSLLPRMLVIIFLTNTSHFLSFNYIVSLIGVPRATGSHSHCPSKTTTGPTYIVLARNLFQATWLHQRSVSDGKMTILILFWATSFILKKQSFMNQLIWGIKQPPCDLLFITYHVDFCWILVYDRTTSPIKHATSILPLIFCSKLVNRKNLLGDDLVNITLSTYK